MATRICVFDWSRTAVGWIGGWPQSLRSAVQIMLAHDDPARLCVGSECLQLYNDSYAALIGSRHPAALGQDARTTSAEAEFIAMLGRVFAGETVTRVDGPDPITHRGAGEPSGSAVTAIPVRDEAGAVFAAMLLYKGTNGRALAEKAIRASEERFRQFAAATSDVLWIRDAETLAMEYVSPAALSIYGIELEAFRADPGLGISLIAPEDRSDVLDHIGRVRRGESVVHDYRIRRPSDGDLRWIRSTGFPLFDDRGRVQRIGGIAEDVTDLRATEAALALSEGRLRTLMEGVPQLVWRAFDGGRWTWASPQWSAYTGQAEEDSHGLGWLKPVHPDDREAVMAVWAGAVARGEFHADYRVRHAATGLYRWFQTRATPVRDESGDVVEWLGTSTDVDDLRRLQESQAVMVAELQHRTRNLIAVVRGIADDTMDETGPTEAFRDAFFDRLTALSRVQGLLSRSEAEPITIGAVVRLELDALNIGMLGEQVSVGGPEVFLRPSTVQTLALALHELATNARKNGALSNASGHLAVSWRERDEHGEHRLALQWVETGSEPSSDRSEASRQAGGYGRELIEQALPHALGARTRFLLADSGVRCTIDIPVRSGRRKGDG